MLSTFYWFHEYLYSLALPHIEYFQIADRFGGSKLSVTDVLLCDYTFLRRIIIFSFF